MQLHHYKRDNPCRYCKPPKRTPTCHITCKEHKEWKEGYESDKAEIDKEKEISRAINDYRSQNVEKALRSRGKIKRRVRRK